MSRLSNLTTVRIGIVRSWNTYWFDKIYYSTLLFNDLKIRDYLTGIFYKLKVISDYIYLYRLVSNTICIRTYLIFFSNLRFKSLTLRKVHKIDPQFTFFYRKYSWRTFLKNYKLYLMMYNYKNKMTIYSNYLNANLTHIEYYANFIKYTYIMLQYHLINSINFIYSYSMYKFNTYNMLSLQRSNIYVNKYTKRNYFYSLYNKFICIFQRNIRKGRFSRYVFRRSLLYKYWSYTVLVKIMFNMFTVFLKYLYLFSKYTFNNIFTTLTNIISYPQYNLVNLIAVSNIHAHMALIQINKTYINKYLFNVLRHKLESSISLYTQQDVYFNFTITFKRNPYMISAKIISDTLVYLLQSGRKMVSSFFFIRNWQSQLYKKRRRLDYLSQKWDAYFQLIPVDPEYIYHFGMKSFPIIGIRIECSGTFKKGRMSQTYFYSSWVRNDLLTGKTPNNTLIADIDYYQYFAITRSSSIGIKTWVFLETYLYNNNNKYIGLVY